MDAELVLCCLQSTSRCICRSFSKADCTRFDAVNHALNEVLASFGKRVAPRLDGRKGVVHALVYLLGDLPDGAADARDDAFHELDALEEEVRLRVDQDADGRDYQHSQSNREMRANLD